MNNSDSYNKRIDNLIKLGVFMILLSGIIFSTTTWNLITGLVKFLLLLGFGIIFYILSIFTRKKLNLKVSSLVYWFLAIIFIYFSYFSLGYFKLLGNWYSFFGEGNKIFISNLFLVLGLLLIISNYKIEKNGLLYLSWNFFYISLALLLSFFKVSIIYSLIIINLISLGIHFIKNNDNKYIKTLQNNNHFLLYVIIFIYMLSSINKFQIVSLFFSILSVINLFLIEYKNKGKITFFDITIPFIIFILIIKNISILELNIKHNILLYILINSIIATICKTVFNKNKELNSSINICNNIFGFICLIILFFINKQNFLLSTSILLIVNLENSMFNTLKTETVLQPYKINIFLYSLFTYLTVNNNIDFSTYLGISLFINLLLCYLMKDKLYIKTYYGIVIITSMVLTTYLFTWDNLIKLSAILFLILASLSIAVINKKDSLKYDTFNYIFYLYLIICVSDSFDISIINTIITIILMLILSIIKLDDKNKSLKISLVAILIPLCHIQDSKLLYSSILISLYLVLLAYIFDKVIKIQDKIWKISTLLILAVLNLFFGDIVEVITMGIILVAAIIYLHNRKEFKGLYNFSLITLIIAIINQLKDFWSSIPFWLYLFIGGVSIMILVTKLELKKGDMKESNNEENLPKDNNYNNKTYPINKEIDNVDDFCENCGAKLVPPKIYCTNCGTKLVTSKVYCTKCGTKLVPPKTYCINCGEKQ